MFSAKGDSKSSLSEGDSGEVTPTRGDNLSKKKIAFRKDAINKEETENLLEQSDDASQDLADVDEPTSATVTSDKYGRIGMAPVPHKDSASLHMPGVRSKPFAKIFPPKIAPPPTVPGHKRGGGMKSPVGQTLGYVAKGNRGDSATGQLSPESRLSEDYPEEGASVSPGALKSMKEMDNQDQQIYNGSTSDDTPSSRGFKLNLQNTARPDSNITAEKDKNSRTLSCPDPTGGVRERPTHGSSATSRSPLSKEKDEEKQRFANSIGLGIDDSKLAFIDETPVETLP